MFDLGRIVFAIALAGFGAQHILYATTGEGPLPGPPWRQAGALWAWVVAGILVWGAAALAARKLEKIAAIAVAGLCLLFAAPLVPALIANVRDPAPWTQLAELVAFAGGALVCGGLRAGRFAFAPPLGIIGVQHFLYATFLATLVPAWIPAPLFWAYLVGAALIAGSVSVLDGALGRAAAGLLALMFALFVAFVHLPRVLDKPADGNEWTSLLVALAMAGAAAAVAGSRRPARA
jgi:uncharacterized membrane protein